MSETNFDILIEIRLETLCLRQYDKYLKFVEKFDSLMRKNKLFLVCKKYGENSFSMLELCVWSHPSIALAYILAVL